MTPSQLGQMQDIGRLQLHAGIQLYILYQQRVGDLKMAKTGSFTTVKVTIQDAANNSWEEYKMIPEDDDSDTQVQDVVNLIEQLRAQAAGE